jgi:hypothetical protein
VGDFGEPFVDELLRLGASEGLHHLLPHVTIRDDSWIEEMRSIASWSR